MITISRATRLFFDASVLIAGARSPIGGSALLLETCRRGGLRAVTSHPVLIEVKRNLRGNTPIHPQERFRSDLLTIPWDIVPGPTDEIVRAYTPGHAAMISCSVVFSAAKGDLWRM